MWFTCYAMAYPQVSDEGNVKQIWRVAASKLGGPNGVFLELRRWALS
jgi:hypothetical protein